jgi:hypothetical protein
MNYELLVKNQMFEDGHRCVARATSIGGGYYPACSVLSTIRLGRRGGMSALTRETGGCYKIKDFKWLSAGTFLRTQPTPSVS